MHIRLATTWTAFGLAISGLLLDSVSGQEPALAVGKPSQFSRVFVPADAVAQMPGEYLPVTSDEFERLVALANLEGQAPADIRLAAAEYESRFDNGELLDGIAKLHVQTSATNQSLPLGECNLQINGAHWLDNGDDDSAARPALLGSASNNQVVAIVPQTGTLTLNWTFRGNRTSTETYLFRLRFPPCPQNELRLILPNTLELSSSDGFVSARSDSPQTTRWTVKTSAPRIDLVISTKRSDESPALAIYQQTAAYRIAPQGIDADIVLQLDVVDAPMSQLDLRLDQQAQITSAKIGDQEVAWNQVAEDQSIIVFPEALGPGRHHLRLHMVAPVPRAESWQLPRMMPHGLVWQKGQITLSVQSPWRINAMDVEGCVQSSNSGAGISRPLAFDCYQPDASIRLSVGFRTTTSAVADGHLGLSGWFCNDGRGDRPALGRIG